MVPVEHDGGLLTFDLLFLPRAVLTVAQNRAVLWKHDSL